MAFKEMELKVAMVSRVTLAHVEILESREAVELQDPRETMASPESQDRTTISLESQDRKGAKVTEDLRADRDLLDLQDLLEWMSVRSWTSS